MGKILFWAFSDLFDIVDFQDFVVWILLNMTRILKRF